ncbi:MAG: hypothetical protein J6V53_03225 [Alphaproteobacteria bacterium]|nr:hypothetical protein [Alphaproteobacteria bacterium]
MKKVGLLLICGLFFSLSVQAQECQKDILLLEKKLADCSINYEENASTAEMNNATYKAADCVISVAHQLFEKFYSSTADESKELFNGMVQKIYEHAHHLKRGSDYASKYYTGTMYYTIAIGTAEEMIQTLVKSYLDEVKSECADR